jgi:hypothetical protein
MPAVASLKSVLSTNTSSIVPRKHQIIGMPTSLTERDYLALRSFLYGLAKLEDSSRSYLSGSMAVLKTDEKAHRKVLRLLRTELAQQGRDHGRKGRNSSRR